MAPIKHWLPGSRKGIFPSCTQELRSTAYILSVLSNPMRLSIMLRLSEGELTMRELSTAISLKVNTINSHLGQLRQGGLVAAEQKGAHTYHSLTDKGKHMVRFVKETFAVVDVPLPS